MSKIEGAPFEEKVALCALNRIFGFEPKIGLRLVETLGSATAVFKEPGEVARALGVCSRNRYAPLITGSAFESAAIELECLERDGGTFLGIGEEGYPALLWSVRILRWDFIIKEYPRHGMCSRGFRRSRLSVQGD